MKGSRVKLTTDSPVESGAFEGIGRLSFLLLGIGLRTHILFVYPYAFISVPDRYRAEQVSVYQFVATLPVVWTIDLIQHTHINTGIFIEQEGTAVLLHRADSAFNLRSQ